MRVGLTITEEHQDGEGLADALEDNSAADVCATPPLALSCLPALHLGAGLVDLGMCLHHASFSGFRIHAQPFRSWVVYARPECGLGSLGRASLCTSLHLITCSPSTSQGGLGPDDMECVEGLSLAYLTLPLLEDAIRTYEQVLCLLGRDFLVRN